MRVAIVGNGVAGCTLYRLLQGRLNVRAELFGRRVGTACGMEPCAWGVNGAKFKEACLGLGLDWGRYMVRQCDFFKFYGRKVACDLVTIDKKALLHDLCGGEVVYATPELGAYDRVIDATGKNGGRKRRCRQWMVRGDFPLEVSFNGLLPPTVAWSFPLGDTAHVGRFSLWGEPSCSGPKGDVLCECESWFSAGLSSRLVEGNLWKVGGAAGVVDPITGSGIIPAILTAKLLAENWESPSGYERSVWERFSYMKSMLRALFHNEYRGVAIQPLRILGVI